MARSAICMALPFLLAVMILLYPDSCTKKLRLKKKAAAASLAASRPLQPQPTTPLTLTKAVSVEPIVGEHHVSAAHVQVPDPRAHITPPQQQQDEELPDVEQTPATAPALPKRYLVFCSREAHKLSEYYMFDEYEKRLVTNPPPWDAYAVLAIGDDSDADCRQQPYFQEALRRRKEAPKIAMPSGWGGTWRGEVHWAADAELRSLANRPLLVKSLGEVFWGPQYGSCSDVDAVLYRSKLHPSAGCLTLHFLQAVSHSHRADATAFHIDSAARVWTTPLNPPYKPKPNFCAIVVKSVILRGHYYIESLVRHAMQALLSEHKPCINLSGKCPGNDLDAAKCLSKYKFAITMENTQELGYVSEKLFAGVLAETVPVYFGAPDVAEHVNPRRFVFCNLSSSVIQKMRSFHVKPAGGRKIDRVFTMDAANPHPTDEQLVAWAKEFLRPHLKRCVDRVIELDGDDAQYSAMLRETLVTKSAVVTGEAIARGAEEAMRVLTGRR